MMTVTPAEAKRQALVIYVFANIGLVFSLALPAAGMINHLLGGIASFERAAALWVLLSLLCILITLPFLRLIQGRILRSK